MNLKALHHYLTTLSPSEEKYRNGYVYDGWKDMPRKQCNGVEYTILDLDVAYSPLDNKPADHSPGLNAELSEISIKKNSRFSTVPEHIHTHIEINYVYSGSCPQVIDGHPITLQKNQVLLIDTNCPHSIAPLGENDIMISIIPKTDFLREHMFNQFSNDSILPLFY